jgi:hypothetical protein
MIRIIPALFITASIMGTTAGLRNRRDTMPTKLQYIFLIKVSGRNAMESGHMEEPNIDDDNAVRLLLVIMMIMKMTIIIIALITRNILLRFVFDPVGCQYDLVTGNNC